MLLWPFAFYVVSFIISERNVEVDAMHFFFFFFLLLNLIFDNSYITFLGENTYLRANFNSNIVEDVKLKMYSNEYFNMHPHN
jgi:hypothetical protein